MRYHGSLGQGEKRREAEIGWVRFLKIRFHLWLWGLELNVLLCSFQPKSFCDYPKTVPEQINHKSESNLGKQIKQPQYLICFFFFFKQRFCIYLRFLRDIFFELVQSFFFFFLLFPVIIAKLTVSVLNLCSI